MAQKIEIPFSFKNITPVKTKEFVFTIGAHPLATDGLDTAIGEVEIPNIPLPGGIYNVWTIAPGTDNIWLSPREYRGLKSTPTKSTYNVNVSWSGGKLEVTWPATLPEGIDSVWITDGYSDFPDNFLSVKVVPGAKLITENPSITKFTVIAWYKPTAMAVAEARNTARLSAYPNPASSTVNVIVPEGTTKLLVTDVTGRELWVFTPENTNTFGDISLNNTFVNEQLVDLRDLDPGLFFITAICKSGVVHTPLIHE